MYKIERADPKKFEEIATFVLSLPETETQNQYKVHEPTVILNLVDWMIKGLVLTVVLDDRIVGILALTEEPSLWWSDETIISNPLLYIRPEHRSLKLFKELLDRAEVYTETLNKEFIPSLIYVDNLEVKERLFKRYGYTPVGMQFRKK